MRAVKDGIGVLRHLAGVRATMPHKLRLARMIGLGSGSYPDAVDTRALAPYKVWDQSSAGTCTCHATPALGVQLLAREGIDWQPSRLWLYAKVRDFEGTPLTEDSGAEVFDVARILETVGAPDESHWPYDLMRLFDEPPAEVDALAHHRTLLGFALPDHSYMRASIGQGFGSSVGVAVYENMMTPECAATGDVKYPEPGERIVGYHDIAAIAYDDHAQIGPDVGGFTFLNSWGPRWGRGGYGRMSYRYMRDFGQPAVTFRREDRT